MQYIYAFISTFTLSLILTGLSRKIGLRLHLFAKPRSRDIHKKPIPRVGGLAIFLSFLIVSVIFFLFIRPDLNFGSGFWFGLDKHLFGIWLGAFIITFSMFLDDIFDLPAWLKLLIQILVAAVVIASGIGIDKLANPFGTQINLNSVYIPIFKVNGIIYHFSLWSDLLTLIWLVGMMNVVNFVDGIDGLAGGVSAIAAFTIFLLSISLSVNQPAVAMLSIILSGAAAGFLFWNFPPAKIFMGDSGSMFLGFMLGILPLLSGGKLATTFLVLGFPIIDGLIVAGGRLLRRKNPFTTPDKTHLHHRFIEAGFSVPQAIFSMYLISAAFAWVALRSTTINKLIAAAVLFFILIMLILYLRRKAGKIKL